MRVRSIFVGKHERAKRARDGEKEGRGEVKSEGGDWGTALVGEEAVAAGASLYRKRNGMRAH